MSYVYVPSTPYTYVYVKQNTTIDRLIWICQSNLLSRTRVLGLMLHA